MNTNNTEVARWALHPVGKWLVTPIYKPFRPANMVNLRFTTLPETKSSPLKIGGWETIVSFWVSAYFQVSFREETLPVRTHLRPWMPVDRTRRKKTHVL